MALVSRIAASLLFGFGLLACSGTTASAQGYGGGQGSPYTGGGTSYIPYGANMSGFIPYSPGLGGLGVQPRMGPMGPREGDRSLMLGGMATSLGTVRTQLTPLAPLGLGGPGMGRTGGLGVMGAGSGMIRRAPASGGMGGGMTRQPVGSYPFRLPPSLVGPSSGPSMSM